MILLGDASVVLNQIPAVFPEQVSPGLAVTDYLFNVSGPSTDDMQGLKADPASLCCYPTPLFIPHDQLHPAEYPTGNPMIQYDLLELTDAYAANSVAPKIGNQELKIVGGLATSYVYAHAPVWCQGGTFIWRRDDGTSLFNGADAFACRWEVADGGTTYLFSFAFGTGRYPQLAYSLDAGATWKIIDPHSRPEGQTANFLQNNHAETFQAIEILFVNFTMQVFIGGRSTPFVFPIRWSSNSAPVISGIAWRATGFGDLNLSFHPLKWSLSGYVDSSLKNMGGGLSFAPMYRLYGLQAAATRPNSVPWAVPWPAGSGITAIRTTGPLDINQGYRLVIENPLSGTFYGNNYSDLTAIATRCAIITRGAWNPVNALYNTPEELFAYGKGLKEIRVGAHFDPESLTVTSDCSLSLDNFYGGSGQNGDRSALGKNLAVNVRLGMASPAIALVQQFLGVIHRYRYVREEGLVELSADDCMYRVKKAYTHDPLDVDGWNHYSAIAAYLEIAGIHVTQMTSSLRAKVPTISGGTLLSDPGGVIDPFAYTAFDPAPFFLPVGSGMSPWTPRNRSMTLYDCLMHVRSATGFVMYFNAAGYFDYHQWVPPTLLGVPAATKTFTEGETGPDGANLTGFWGCEHNISTDNVRNVVVLVGVDAFSRGTWAPIVVRQEDAFSIGDPTAANYVGWKQPFVWTDSKFASLSYATEVAQRALAYMRVPEIEVSFETYLQPTIFPMQVVYVQEAKSGYSAVPFYVTNTQKTMTVRGGSLRMRTRIRGVYISMFAT